MSSHFIIVFVGLIAHFSLPTKSPSFERAVLTNQYHHTPYLILRESDIIPPKPQGQQSCPGGDKLIVCYEIWNSHVTLGDLSGKYPRSFDKHVPKLSLITDDNIPANAIENADLNFPHALAYVDYSGGCVKAPEFAGEATWSNNCRLQGIGHGCVPAYTVRDSISSSAPIGVDIQRGRQHIHFQI